MTSPSPTTHSVSSILRNRSFVLFCSARVTSTLAYQMLAVAVGWQVYALTKSAFYLGMVGLAQFLPMVLLTLVSGHVADRFDRRTIMGLCQLFQAAGVTVLAVGSFSGWISKESILVLAFCIGTGRTFQMPAQQALLPLLVTPDEFPRATAMAASSMEAAAIFGPALGGILYILGAGGVYSVITGLFLIGGALSFLMEARKGTIKREPATVKSVLAGINFIWMKKTILGAISLDLFAVLLGGATALLPIYAGEILMVGPRGLGFLRAAPAIGALMMSLYLARHPLKQKVGKIMFGAVVVFGLATLGFAVSKWFLVSLVMLIILGAADIISVVIRSSLVQLKTPDEMRGRVSAVNMMFIGTSNQLGEFESGVTAAWFGTVPSVIIGGLGTIVVALSWMRLFPELADTDRLEQ
jgi:MFS family permease